MFTVAVADHVMIAHSLRGEAFGPAQRLHGATYRVIAEWKAAELDDDGVVVDIGRARELLGEELAPLCYRNLDELEEFSGCNTTTEFLARWLHGRLAGRLPEFRGALRVVLEESPVAWAAFEGPVGGGL